MAIKSDLLNIGGFLLINKHSGPTSHDIIDELRKITGIRKIGHAGTLDPFASGLLIVGVGREATRQLGLYLKLDKTYIATLKLGAISDTYDLTGKIQTSRDNNQIITKRQTPVTKPEIEKVLEKFRGEIEQIPPMYSAKKVKGKKLYELARKGIEIERKSVKVTIYSLQIIRYSYPILELKTRVSSGTYIRSLAHDIGQALPSAELGTSRLGAYLEELVRTEIGDYKLKDAVEISELNSENWEKHIKDLI